MHSLYIVGLAFAALGKCESIFINPKQNLADNSFAENPVYSLDENVKIEWKTDRIGGCNLFLWQTWPQPSVAQYQKILDNTTDTSYVWNASSWDVTTKPWVMNDTDIPVFHFALYASDLDIQLANSGNFNISKTTEDELEPSATSISAPSATSLESESSTNPHHSEPTQIPATEQQNHELSTAALVGISVGVTFAGLLISGIIGICLWRRFRRSQGGSQTSESSTDEPSFSKAELGNTQVLQIGRSEMDSEREAQELWDTQKMAELGDENKVRVVVGLHEAP
ncbi:uncharacterized protein B0J16DRAFT_395783 [Fusarium flagelliforme]|uniref:uncharacterized protein n=1 Tax=Fusarium flagelliforme TaxID=2675880 RepID=UPI001E8D620F|nr:uncharacterized protein B0J16DRAFT_395783 [Fusarium flagelliforme]KAH7193818.1 hypothetical protein B0J16DRAFT_395783 [Fusarium flagelliforme]